MFKGLRIINKAKLKKKKPSDSVSREIIHKSEREVWRPRR
jgi:hypothetical protein